MHLHEGAIRDFFSHKLNSGTFPQSGQVSSVSFESSKMTVSYGLIILLIVISGPGALANVVTTEGPTVPPSYERLEGKSTI